jgi:clan AA aspartic protease (TIGR02281 family)
VIKLDPQDRILQAEERRFPIVAVLLIALVAIVGGGAAYWYLARPETADPGLRDVYAQLGIAPLPPGVERQQRIRSRLDQLRREPCYRDAMIDLSDALVAAGYARESATSLIGFAKRCTGSDDLLAGAYDALLRVSDFREALRVADELVKNYPSISTYRYWRAKAHDQLKDYPAALNDYLNSVQLVGEPRTIIGDAFYAISRMYVELGRPCDAIAPIETYISFDPANRRNPQTTKIIAEYAKKGSCEARHARGVSRVAFSGGAGVHTLPVSVNGVVGNFILDTGATFVSVTSRFAARAKVNVEAGNQVVLKTVGGTSVAEVGYANSISVAQAEAQGVVVAVLQSPADPFGNRIDGLLGMSFLARFKVTVSPTTIELAATPL